ncbi:hypothetical protein MUK42_08817 [Musa troglodytarum]|uniref:Uncharacterized protein n=1 Tax=Musa troglodytarum TaxID=320322 RepID=A0A9E7ELG3_9LILI|nr:hypothetical protein MUK42_08817 [Musa troglodytarum]
MNQGEEGITIKKRRFRLISVSRPDSSLPVRFLCLLSSLSLGKNSAGVEVEDDHEQMAEEPVSKKAKRNWSNFMEAAVSSADEIGRGSIALLHPTISSLGLQGPRRKYRMVTQFSFGFNLAKTNYGHTSPRALMKLFLVSTVLYFTPHCDDAV